MASRRSRARATTSRPPTADAGPGRGMQCPERRGRFVAPHGAAIESASSPRNFGAKPRVEFSLASRLVRE